MTLPDPEHRKFLKTGSVEGVREALSPHFAAGLEEMNIDANNYLLAYKGKFIEGDTKQQLKLTVRAANALMGA